MTYLHSLLSSFGEYEGIIMPFRVNSTDRRVGYCVHLIFGLFFTSNKAPFPEPYTPSAAVLYPLLILLKPPETRLAAVVWKALEPRAMNPINSCLY